MSAIKHTPNITYGGRTYSPSCCDEPWGERRGDYIVCATCGTSWALNSGRGGA